MSLFDLTTWPYTNLTHPQDLLWVDLHIITCCISCCCQNINKGGFLMYVLSTQLWDARRLGNTSNCGWSLLMSKRKPESAGTKSLSSIVWRHEDTTLSTGKHRCPWEETTLWLGLWKRVVDRNTHTAMLHTTHDSEQTHWARFTFKQAADRVCGHSRCSTDWAASSRFLLSQLTGQRRLFCCHARQC